LLSSSSVLNCMKWLCLNFSIWCKYPTNYTKLLNFSWAANSQEIPHALWSPKIHYCAHETLPLDRILVHMNPVSTQPSRFLTKISCAFIWENKTPFWFEQFQIIFGQHHDGAEFFQ
jgi:hypothetical protein